MLCCLAIDSTALNNVPGYDKVDRSSVNDLEIYQALNSDSHEWLYYPRMHRDEVLIFKTYDRCDNLFVAVPLPLRSNMGVFGCLFAGSILQLDGTVYPHLAFCLRPPGLSINC